ncbi:MAG: response regulator transcription factor [Candidatus Dormibacteraeota bacterium]|uniref:Response regulator transcription factor n=1 Tax=Candidatus Amunia macphersoniae TaxID=3127014 RepID=A0A934KMM4_9BACT|nr:response regulator transcription factor [Candidatus Dormibacteraeota bacterium]
MIRVLLADDQALVRGGFRLVLESATDLEVVGDVGDGESALSVVAQLHPDVVLMDIRMPGMNGIDATRRIAADESLRGTRVLIVTTFEIDEYVFAALRAGASGFVLKDIEPADLLVAVRVVAGGDALLSPSVTSRLIADFTARSEVRPVSPQSLAELTDREREVLAQVALGRSNEEIGSQLFMSPATAKTHVSRVMSKLAARDRAQLVIAAYESGLVVPGRT